MAATDDTTDQLLTRSGRGDRQAFGKLYDLVAPQLLAIARRILHDHHQAEDALQQAMIAAWNTAGEFDPERSRATTWLTSITRYRAIDMLRQHGRRQDVMQNEKSNIQAVLGHDAPVSPADPLPASTAQRLEFCFGEISRDQAGCIQLAYLDGLTFTEISDRLERSMGTVKSWVRRGLQKLRECIQQ